MLKEHYQETGLMFGEQLVSRYIECIKCEGTAHIEHELDHGFYVIKFCPFCGEELELEEELILDDAFEQEYQANN